MLFGTGSAKFERSGSTVLLEHSNIRPNWCVRNIETQRSVFDHYTTATFIGDYSDFWIDINLFDYTSSVGKYNEIYPTYAYSYVYFWPHADGNAISGSNNKPSVFFIRDMEHRYLSDTDARRDILSLHFVSTDYTDIETATTFGGDMPIFTYGDPFDYYQIWNARQLQTYCSFTASTDAAGKIMTSFDCSELTNFTGSALFLSNFNGNNKTLYNLTMYCRSGSGGLFKNARGAKFYDLTLYNAKLVISGSVSELDDWHGLLVGKYYGRAIQYNYINNVHIINSKIESTCSIANRVGGIIGASIVAGPSSSYMNYSSVQGCEFNLSCSGAYVGSIASSLGGNFANYYLIDRSFAANNNIYISSSGSKAYLGGFILQAGQGIISSSYAHTIQFNVDDNGLANEIGGFIYGTGAETLRFVHSETTTGSISPLTIFYPTYKNGTPSQITSSYYDFEFSDNYKASGSDFIALSSSDAIDQAGTPYAGFDFTNIWSSSLDIHSGYPHLKALRGITK